MKYLLRSIAIFLAALIATSAMSQEPVQANANHQQMLASSDARLATNKKLVYDFWREVFEAGHFELAEKYLTESYIQHNPRVPSGRAAFVEAFSKIRKRSEIEARVKGPIVAMIAEGDLVLISFVREVPEPTDPSKKYTTTWFDMFRVEGGKIAEHWDGALKP